MSSAPPRRSVFLVGFMATGKTSVGRELAARLDRPFVDLDEVIEEGAGKPIRAMAKEELKAIENWRKEFCAPLQEDERQALVELSDAIDKLWIAHVELLKKVNDRTTDPLTVYGKSLPPNAPPRTTTASPRAPISISTAASATR